MEAQLAPVIYTPKKLDIGSGVNPGPPLRDRHGGYVLDAAGKMKRETGWTGIDLEPNADIVWDLWQFPWPIASGVVQQVNVAHFVEHVPHYMAHWPPGRDGWFLFWEEVYRITKKGATVDIIHPFLKHDRAFWDPTHVRFISGETWAYLDADWREANGLSHYTTANFENTVVAYAGIAEDMVGRNDEFVHFHQQHSWNVHPDLAVTLKRR